MITYFNFQKGKTEPWTAEKIVSDQVSKEGRSQAPDLFTQWQAVQNRANNSDILFYLGENAAKRAGFFNILEAPNVLIEAKTLEELCAANDQILLSLYYLNNPKLTEFCSEGSLTPQSRALFDFRRFNYCERNEDKEIDYIEKLMEQRLELLAQNGFRDFAEYNRVLSGSIAGTEFGKREKLICLTNEHPNLFLFYLVTQDTGEEKIEKLTKLAQTGRRAGIHVIVSSTEEAVDPLLKANLAFRIRTEFKHSNKEESTRTLSLEASHPSFDPIKFKAPALIGENLPKSICGL